MTRRRPASSPDFGDMGTAFGLDAITPVITEWARPESEDLKMSDEAMHAGRIQTLRTSEAS